MPDRTDIPQGRDNAIPRAQLARLWRLSDRDTRRIIAHMRAITSDDGFAILSTSHNPAGYWRSAEPHEIKQFIVETEARARNTFVALRDAKRILAQLDTKDQLSISL